MKNNTHQDLSENALLEILRLSHDATAIYIGEELYIQFANDKMIGFWGKDRSILGSPLSEAVPELQDQQFIGLLQNVWRTGVTYEARNTAAQLNVNGYLETFYFDFVYRALLNADGTTYCILHTACDVTERISTRKLVDEKNAELHALSEELILTNRELIAVNAVAQATNDELTETQLLKQNLDVELSIRQGIFKSLFEQAPLGICWLSGPDLVITEINDPLLRIWRRKREDVVGLPHHKARPELNGQVIFDLLDKVYQTGNPQINSELRILLKDGESMREAYVNSVYSAVKDRDGEVTGVIVIVDDITDRISERLQKKLLQDQMRMTLESAELGTWYIDAESSEIITTPRVKELFGFHASDSMSIDNALAQITDEYRDKVKDAITNAINSQSKYAVEYPVIGFHDSTLRWVRATGSFYPGTVGQRAHLSGIIMDITERKTDEARKNDFIAIVSHELKTPLTSAKAYTQMLAAKAAKAGDIFFADNLKMIEKQIGKMSTLIRGFLDVARLEAGKIQLIEQSFLINELVKECAEEAKLFSENYHITVLGEQAIMVNADRDKIGQVINNFLSNAIKYSSSGTRIEIICERQDNNARISVRDEGMGIKPEDLNRLFERFFRVDSKYTKTISGFGIGLYLCREIIKRHGGHIGASSELGKGSVFYFDLPLSS